MRLEGEREAGEALGVLPVGLVGVGDAAGGRQVRVALRETPRSQLSGSRTGKRAYIDTQGGKYLTLILGRYRQVTKVRPTSPESAPPPPHLNIFPFLPPIPRARVYVVPGGRTEEI